VLVLVAQLTAELGGVPLALLSRKTVRTWWALHEGKVSRGEWRPATANQRLGLLRHVYNVALANGDVDHNPTLGLRKARTDPSTLPTEHLTDAERDRVLEACATASLDLHVAALLALYYGARRNTVLVTKIQDIAWDRGVLTLHATKTRARREHPIHPRVDAPLRALCAAREGAEALVRYTPAGLTHAWARVVRRLGLGRRFRFHGLRHDFGTRLFAGTKDLRLTQEALGHARVAQTERYTHVAAGAVNGALLGLR
jgi:integrase